jgi:hypothetical protein
MEMSNPLKRPRTDVHVESGKLSAPPLFTTIIPRPRLSLLPREKRTPVNAGRNASATGGGGGSGGSVIEQQPIARSRAGSVGTATATSAAVQGGDAGVGGGSSVGVLEPGPIIVRAPVSVALDEYLAWVGNTYYTATESGAACREWAILRRTTLGRLTAPAREGRVFDLWAPIQIAKFEAAICLYGKDFAQISKVRVESRWQVPVGGVVFGDGDVFEVCNIF